MAWIESHQELARHPKTKRFSRLAEISLPTAIGHLHLLWWWAIDYAQDGDLSKYDIRDITDAMEWPGDATVLIDAMVKSGFLDRENDTELTIHDWHDYAGRLMEQRKAQVEYKRRQYALYNDMRLTKAVKKRDGDNCRYCGKTVNWNDRRGADGGTYDLVDPNGENTPDNTVVCCRSCGTKKDGKTLEEAKMTLIGSLTVETSENTVDSGKSTAEKPDLIEQRFNEFWAAYPRKQGKGDARKKWQKLKPSADLHSKILKAIEQAKQSDQWRKNNGQYIPNPSTWLNQSRWEDELQTAGGLTNAVNDRDSNGFNPVGMQGFKNALDRFDNEGNEISFEEFT